VEGAGRAAWFDALRLAADDLRDCRWRPTHT